MLETGKTYQLRLNVSQGKSIKFHVDYLLTNPIEPSIENTLVVGRMWIKSKNRWEHLIYQAWELYLYNKDEKVLNEYKISFN